MVQRGAGKIQVDPIVRLNLLPLGTGQFPIGRIGEFLEPSGPEIGANRFERREVAGLPRPGGQVDVVSLDRGPRPRPIAQIRRDPGPVVLDEARRDRVRNADSITSRPHEPQPLGTTR